MELLDIKNWILIQMVVDLFLILVVIYFFQKSKGTSINPSDKKTMADMLNMIEPLLKEAQKTAETFEAQLKEKHELIQRLNESLDSRIISLNLLLDRARTEKRLQPKDTDSSHSIPLNDTDHVYDQQESILKLFEKGLDSESISNELSLPRREVELVLDLKKKLIRMENNPNQPN